MNVKQVIEIYNILRKHTYVINDWMQTAQISNDCSMNYATFKKILDAMVSYKIVETKGKNPKFYRLLQR